jgi:hypothetical protein
MTPSRKLWNCTVIAAVGLAGLLALRRSAADEPKKPAPRPDPRKLVVERPIKALAADPRALLEELEAARLAATEKAKAVVNKAAKPAVPSAVSPSAEAAVEVTVEIGGVPVRRSSPAAVKHEMKSVVVAKPAGAVAKSTVAVGKAGAAPANPKVEPGLVKWHGDFAAARAASARSGKPVLLFQMLGRMDEHFC